MIKGEKNIMYNVVVCGGTFDLLHPGHQAFLRFAFSQAKHVVVGLTTDAYILQYKPNKNIHSYEERKSALEQFLSQEQFQARATIIPIDDPYGTAIDDNTIEAIIVTEDTRQTAEEINQQREKKSLQQLPIIIFPLVTINNIPLSSTAIRLGADLLWQRSSFLLPEQLREKLKIPLGSVLSNDIEEIHKFDEKKIITVGDVTTKRLLESHIHPKISIVDFIVERKKMYTSLQQIGFSGKETILELTNPPGHIEPQIWEILHNIKDTLSTEEQFIILVEGEEDLLVIPLVLLLPVGYYVLYGQPHQGLVVVEITEEKKSYIASILKQFLTKDY